uniref:DUF4758 domain-containing protein n=1 Tax=Heliothis virescens TaxID=7102 RepID=A0A2A4JU50_HELVI
MRLFVFNCLLLASVALASPNGREKRDLAYLKNLISSAIFGRQKIDIQQPSIAKTESDYKLFRLPGYEDIMVKVSPRKSSVKEFVYPPVEPVNLNAFGSVVGTKSKDETLVAVKGVENLLSTGILYGGPNKVMKETIAPMFPTLNKVKYVAEEKIEAVPVIETAPPQPPVLTEVVQPSIEEKVEFKVPFEPKYTYKQMKNHEPMLTYTAHNNPDVELVETVKMNSVLPMCIKQRIDEAIVLGSDPYRLAPVQEIYQEQTAPVVDISYGKGEEYFYVPQPSFQNRFIETFGAAANFGLFPERVRPSKGSSIHQNVRPTKIQAINRRPIPSKPHQAPNSEVKISATKERVNDQKNVKVFSNSGDKVDITKTLGPIPQYVVRSSKKQLSAPKEKGVNQMKSVQIVASKDSIANSRIPDTEYQNQRNPNTGKVIQESKDWRTNLKTNVKQYIVVGNATSEGLKKTIELAVDGLHTNKVTAKPQSVTRPMVISGTKGPKVSALRENKPVLLKENPAATPKVKQYSYQQKHADGSSTNIKGNKQGVSVNVKPKYSNAGRGDIPDEK